MTEILLTIAIVLLLAVLALLVVLLIRRPADLHGPVQVRFDALERNQERSERAVQEEMAKNRNETSANAARAREEMASTLKGFGDSLAAQLTALTKANEDKLENLRNVVDGRLKQIQEDNTRQLERMRTTVDEKLQGTLEKRLGESFKQVSERLEQVHKGLGEMQALATGVGDLKRALTNVKTRGIFGEIQLGALLDQILTPEQYAQNVKTKEASSEHVEFAIKLPGQAEGEWVWLPVDAKFPTEDYQRLVAAQERADLPAVEAAQKELETRIKTFARSISEKYLNPPQTTDFGIMFLPTEGLYAEVVRKAELIEALQRDSHVIVAGPTTFAALLNSLRMGFRTLAIQKRSSEVWELLGAVKTEFGKFGAVLEATKKKLEQASNSMEDAARRSRAIERKLRNVQELPSAATTKLLDDGVEEPPSQEPPAA
jgi:DNA recombination protein RmuC